MTEYVPVEPGSRFGRLTVVSTVPPGVAYPSETGVQVACDCGTEKTIRRGNLLHGKTRSCGCLYREVFPTHPPKDQPFPGELAGRKVTAGAILELLEKAGDEGMLVSDLLREFGVPADRSKRNRIVNGTLVHIQKFGGSRVRRSDAKERSPYYLRGWAYRWFITEEGKAWLHRGPSAAELARTERLQAQQRIADALKHAAEQEWGPDTPKDVRNRAVKELRAAGVHLEDIGAVFNFTRERARQLLEWEPRCCMNCGEPVPGNTKYCPDCKARREPELVPCMDCGQPVTVAGRGTRRRRCQDCKVPEPRQPVPCLDCGEPAISATGSGRSRKYCTVCRPGPPSPHCPGCRCEELNAA